MPLIKSFNPSTNVDTVTNTITIPSHGFGTIDGVIYRNGNGSSIGGLVHNTKYYVIVVDANNIQLAATEILARSSTEVDLLTTGSGTTHTLEFTTIYPLETAIHNIYQNIRLTGGGVTNPDGEIITAETVSDTLNIIGGQGVSFTAVSNDTKSFAINATQYDFEVPVGTTNLRLFSDSGDDQSIILTPARGIAITRIGSQEVEFESFGVTETDTLQSISERGNITNNKLIMDNLMVAKIESTPGIDGVVNYNTTGTTGTAIALTGNGTLDNELLFSPDYATSTEAAKDVYVNFQSPTGQGTLSYTAVYTSESTLTTGSVILQRNDGGGWVTIDNVSGTTVDQSYEINGNYAEVNSATIDYRIVFSWTGSTDVVTYRIRVSYEVENVPGTEIIMTDTDTEVLTLGTLGGTVNIRGAINLADEISTDQLAIYNNNIVALNSDTDINLEPAGVGAVQVRSNWLSTNQSYINVFTDSQVDEVYIGSTTSLTTVNDNLRILDDVEIRGGNLTTTRESFNLFTSSRLRRSISGDRYWQFTSTEVNQSGAGNTGFWIQYLEPIPNSYIYTSTFDSSLTWGINFHEDELNVPLVPGSIPIDQSAGGDYIKLENDDIIIVFQLNGNAGYGGPGRTIYRNLILVYSSLGTYDMAGKTFTITRGDVYNPIVGLQRLNVANAETDINLGNININDNVIDTNDSAGITFTPVVTFNTDVNVENDLRVTQDFSVGKNSFLDGDLTVLKNVQIEGTTLNSNTGTFNLLTTPNDISFGTNANSITVGKAGGLITSNSNVIVNQALTAQSSVFLGDSYTDIIRIKGALQINQGASGGTGGGGTNSGIGFSNGGEAFNIRLTDAGQLEFVANTNNIESGGNVMMVIDDDSVTVATNNFQAGVYQLTNTGISTTDSSAIVLLKDVQANGFLDVDTDLTVGQDATIGNNLFVGGNLIVQGSTATLNTQTLDVEDLNITIAKGAADATAANGAGLTIEGANANLTYRNSDDSFVFDKRVTVNGDLYFYNDAGTTLAGSIRNDFGRLEFYNEDGTRMFYFENTQDYISVDRAVVISGSHYLSASEIRQSAGTAGGINIECGTSGTILLGTGTTDHELNVTDGVVGINGFLETEGVSEKIDPKTGATGTVTHDLDTATVFYHTTPAADFTANFTNTPTTNDRAISIALIVIQGSSAYIPSAVQIDGVAQTIQWSGGITPAGSPNQTDVFSFTLFRVSSAWLVIGALSTYG